MVVNNGNFFEQSYIFDNFFHIDIFGNVIFFLFGDRVSNKKQWSKIGLILYMKCNDELYLTTKKMIAGNKLRPKNLSDLFSVDKLVTIKIIKFSSLLLAHKNT